MTDPRRPDPGGGASGSTMMAPSGPAPSPAQSADVPEPRVPAVSGGYPGATGGAPVPVAAVSSQAIALEGTVLADRYRVIKKLGEGGMGSVYLAEHTTINKKLAIKVLSSEYCHKQDLVDRFLQEARAASMIEQENVVEITDFGSTPTGSVFFVMEFLNGEDLSQTVKDQGPMPWARVKAMMLQICAALDAAHNVGIIHRDMKPENCYRIRRGGSDDFIKVLDFGIAKVTSEDGEGAKGLTRTGMIFGTPEYMSPEQAKGERVDQRVDVYAVGIILYELLTGQVPFTADTFMGILTKHMFEAPPAPSSVREGLDIPAKVEAIILKALQKDREYRFQTMAEFAEAIRAVGTSAAPVNVVAESIVQPTRGQTRFSSISGVPVVYPPPSNDDLVEDDSARARATGVTIGVVTFIVALAGAGAAYFLNRSGDARPTGTERPPSGLSTAKTVAVAPVPTTTINLPIDESPPVEPVVPETVEITVSVPKVDGQVTDSNGTVLGRTNEAFEVPVGSEPMDLLVEADGYQEATVSLVPGESQTVEASLTKIRRRGKGGRTRSKGAGAKGRTPGKGNQGPSAPSNSGTPTPSNGGDTKPKGGSKPHGGSKPNNGSPDLKDPFKGR